MGSASSSMPKPGGRRLGGQLQPFAFGLRQDQCRCSASAPEAAASALRPDAPRAPPPRPAPRPRAKRGRLRGGAPRPEPPLARGAASARGRPRAELPVHSSMSRCAFTPPKPKPLTAAPRLALPPSPSVPPSRSTLNGPVSVAEPVRRFGEVRLRRSVSAFIASSTFASGGAPSPRKQVADGRLHRPDHALPRPSSPRRPKARAGCRTPPRRPRACRSRGTRLAARRAGHLAAR